MTAALPSGRAIPSCRTCNSAEDSTAALCAIAVRSLITAAYAAPVHAEIFRTVDAPVSIGELGTVADHWSGHADDHRFQGKHTLDVARERIDDQGEAREGRCGVLADVEGMWPAAGPLEEPEQGLGAADIGGKEGRRVITLAHHAGL